MRLLGFKSGVRPRSWQGLAGTAALVGLTACGTTVDSLGSDSPSIGGGHASLRPLSGPTTYPNAFRDVLGKSPTDIQNKIDDTFAQLFHGDPSNQAIYFPVSGSPDQAEIQDLLHSGQVRTEGMGYAMIIAVELDKRPEFDKLWRFAKTLRVQSGADEGYFTSTCDKSTSSSFPCNDPFGMEQMAMALIFAHDRWVRPLTQADAAAVGEAGVRADGGSRPDAAVAGDASRDASDASRDASDANAATIDADAGSGTIDYEADALALLDVMLHKEAENGGVVGEVTNVFDSASQLVFDLPDTLSAGVGRPSIEMPAYYELWYQATGDMFWSEAAAAARRYWSAATNSTTGLIPVRANFDGGAVPSYNIYAPEAYRTQLNMTLDRIWFGSDDWEVTEANLLVAFFASYQSTCRTFTLDGTSCLDTTYDESLISTKAVSALISTDAVNRKTFIQNAWDLMTPTGQGRYYSGILDLLGLLILSGNYQVY
jgi:oligosaccharide reducing-end xylanase